MKKQQSEVCFMKGYYTSGGYCGMVNGKYFLFASEEDYRDFMESGEE